MRRNGGRATALLAVFCLSACVEYGLMEPVGPFQANRPPTQTDPLAKTLPEPAAPEPAATDAGSAPRAPAPPVPAAPSPAPSPPPEDAVFRISRLPAEWDGAETVGGLWVALPYLPAYRRVLVRDPATGRAVVAKLYWRDPLANADEAVLSSAAAEALGLGPGRADGLEATVLAGE